MQIAVDRLPRFLAESPLPSSCLVFGAEPLQQLEATDAIRAKARADDVAERIVLTVDGSFDWRELARQTENLSLFGERRLIELRLGDQKPGRDGSAAICEFLDQGGEDILLMTAGKLDRKAQQGKWFKALDGAGLTIACWPVDAQRLPDWIARRLADAGIDITADAARLLAERVEGNLLAAKQELDRLALLLGEGRVDVDNVLEAVSDHARFDLFDLPDCALAGDAARTLRVLDVLQAEGVEAVMVSWLLCREIRQLVLIAGDFAGGQPAAAVMQRHGVWKHRQPALQAALRRLHPSRLDRLLADARHVDRMIKGAAPGEPWPALRALALGLAGVELPRTPGFQ
jgi:DNA polymerase-3 subunit delta